MSTLPNPHNAEIADLDAYRQDRDTGRPKVTEPAPELTPLDHIETASAALTMHRAFGIVQNRDSLIATIGIIKPPRKLESPDDLKFSVNRDYYANFIIFGLVEEDQGLDKFMQARSIYSTLGSTCLTISRVIKRISPKDIQEASQDAISVLDTIAAEARAKNLKL